jgi:hypothetical protein
MNGENKDTSRAHARRLETTTSNRSHRYDPSSTAPNSRGTRETRCFGPVPVDAAFVVDTDAARAVPDSSVEARSFAGLARCRSAIEDAASWCVQRAPARVIVVRAVIGVVLLVGLVAWFVPRPPNLATGKSVLMDGNCAIRPTHSPWPVGPHRLVDGKKTRSYDACTALSANPWVRVDLGAEVPIGRVVVSGRADCCWQEGVPLVLEVSADGSTYREIARRVIPFTRDRPWSSRHEGVSARFLRLRAQAAPRLSMIVLSEVEVFPP